MLSEINLAKKKHIFLLEFVSQENILAIRNKRLEIKTIKLESMKKTFFSVMAASALFLTACGGGEDAATDTNNATNDADTTAAEPVMADYTVDAAASTLEWKGYENGNMEEHYHIGSVGIKEGTISTKDGAITGGSVTIDMGALNYQEGISHGNVMNEESESVAKLWGHLKSNDIFAIDSIPTATFTINSADENGVNGTLTVMGKDVSLTIPGQPSMDGDALVHTTDWFPVDLSGAVPFFGTMEGAEEPGMKLSMKLNLSANK